MTNDDFAEQVVRATLDETSDVADTAELFVRAAKLMSLSGRWTRAGTSDHGIPRPAAENARERMTQGAGVTDKTDRQIQPLVRALMTTLLVDHRTLLGESDRCNLMDADYCKRLGLKLGFPLLRKKEEGREVNGHDRYWKDPCDGFYVCSQWWKDHHVSNARHLVDFMQDIARKNPGHPGMPALQIHMEALRNFAR